MQILYRVGVFRWGDGRYRRWFGQLTDNFHKAERTLDKAAAVLNLDEEYPSVCVAPTKLLLEGQSFQQIRRYARWVIAQGHGARPWEGGHTYQWLGRYWFGERFQRVMIQEIRRR